MMNKKILLSVAAAATISTLLTGCGSSSSSSSDSATGTSVSGVAEKSALKNALVTIGNGTATTDANGEYTVTGATGTAITVANGEYLESNGTALVYTTNDVTLRATTTGNAAGAVNLLTTLVEDFKDEGSTEAQAIAEVQSIFGLSGDANTSIYGAVNTGNGNAKENISRIIHQLLKDTASSTTARGELISSMRTQAKLAAGADANLTSMLTNIYILVAAADSTVSFTIPQAEIANFTSAASLALQPAAFSYGVAEGNATKAASSQIQIENTMILENNVSISTIDANTTFDLNTTVVNTTIDTNGTVDFTNSSDLNETGELLFKIAGLDSANENASYAIRLNNLVASLSGGDVALELNSNTSAAIQIESSTGVAMTLVGGTTAGADFNKSALFDTDMFMGEDANLTFNISKFANYVTNTVGASYDSATNGNFTSGMTASGNFSVEMYLDVNDQNMTLSEQYNFAPRGTVEIGAEGTTAGTLYNGYKILDANLTK